MKILHRFSGATLFESDHATMRETLVAALKARANLARADLEGADLKGADLEGAYLEGADLNGAYLEGAYLEGAYLEGADLEGADLEGANLAGADLEGANLAGAYLEGAYLEGAYLAGAYLAGATLAGARNLPAVDTEAPTEPYERKPSAERYAERAARFRERNPQVPFVESLDAKILGVIESGVGKLDMSNWHQCQTTHCRAGWAITLAGAAGKDLENLHGPERAGAMIYRASTGRVPHFFASNEQALQDIREQAALQTSAKDSPSV